MDVAWAFILMIIIIGSFIAARVLIRMSPIEVPEGYLTFDKQIEKFVAEGVKKEYQSEVLRGML